MTLSLWISVALLVIAPDFIWAADAKPSQNSLDKVPADVDVYSSTLRLGETIQTIAKSRVWTMIWSDPALQELWKKSRETFEGEDEWPFIKKFIEDPVNKDLLALALDALSQEIFFYAGSGWADLVALGNQVYGGVQFGPAFAALLGSDDDDLSRKQFRKILQVLAAKPERLRIHDLVVGFKVSDPAKVSSQLKRLDPFVAEALQDTPLKGCVERIKVGDDEFLTLKVDGSIIPWDLIPLGMFEDKEGEFAPLFAHLKKTKLQIALGVRQGYLLLALGDSSEVLAKFGGKGPKLASLTEFNVLEKAAGKPVTSIGYTSAAFRKERPRTLLFGPLSVKATNDDSARIAEAFRVALKESNLPETQVKAIEKDVDAFVKELAPGTKKPGSNVNFSYRTQRGWETLDYDFNDVKVTESRPLTLLNHLGGNPLMAAVWRSGTTVEDYRFFVRWAEVFGKHFEAIAAANAPNIEELKKYREELLPLIKEISDITEKSWMPALADGQEGFVVDAKWSSRNWHDLLQQANAELPMPELGIVLGVSDSAKLERALEGYRGWANKVLVKARGEVPAGTIPDFEFTKPKVERESGNTFAYYPIPEEWGIDKQFQPTGGLSKKVAALTLSRGHSERLLKPAPLRTDSALLADTERPLESVFFINWAGIVDIGTKWIPHLRKLEIIPDEDEAEHLLNKVLTVSKAFRGYTSVSYREKGATVTHSEAVFRDIEPEKK